jgi:hypothetical protein
MSLVNGIDEKNPAGGEAAGAGSCYVANTSQSSKPILSLMPRQSNRFLDWAENKRERYRDCHIPTSRDSQ